MKEFRFPSGNMKKTIEKIFEKSEKLRQALKSFWVQVKPAFGKYGDKLLLALALAVLVTALFHREEKKAIAGAAEAVLVFTHWQRTDVEKDAPESFLREFEQLHRGIKIVLNQKSYEEMRCALFHPEVSGDESPGDILAVDPLWAPELERRKTIEAPEVPPFSFINVLYYNIELLREAGFSRPPKNRSEFSRYAKEAAGKKNDCRGLVLALGENSSRGVYDDIYPWIWAAGAPLLKEGKPALSSRTVVDSLAFLAALSKGGLITPGAFSSGVEEKREDFIRGKAVFMIASTADIALLRERMGEDAFGITAIPPPDNYAGRAVFGTGGWTVGIYSGSKHKEEAAIFTAFLSEKASLLSQKLQAIPGTGGGFPPQAAENPFYSKAWDLAISSDLAQEFSGLPGEYKLEEAFRKELLELFNDEKKSPAETAASIQKKWEALLSE
jgi:multiple sugar transport system substrate-binding protein